MVRWLLLGWLALAAPVHGAARGIDERSDAATAARTKLAAAGVQILAIAQGSKELTINFAIGAPKAGDAEVALLGALQSPPPAGAPTDAAVGETIVELDLGGTAISDAALATVGQLKTLRRLVLRQTGVTDAGLKALTGLAVLESLNLYGTKVGDAGLAPLAELKQLKRLYLWQTAVTDGGVEKLQAALPALAIQRGAKPPPPASCCEQAKAANKACDHPCCVAATAAGHLCFKCHPDRATTCCEKAEAGGKACEHPCCVAATAAGQVCFKCNPARATTCCEKAQAAGKECEHPCCIEARQAGKLCEKCNPPKQK